MSNFRKNNFKFQNRFFQLFIRIFVIYTKWAIHNITDIKAA